MMISCGFQEIQYSHYFLPLQLGIVQADCLLPRNLFQLAKYSWPHPPLHSPVKKLRVI